MKTRNAKPITVTVFYKLKSILALKAFSISSLPSLSTDRFMDEVNQAIIMKVQLHIILANRKRTVWIN